jgi:hypothetical protein
LSKYPNKKKFLAIYKAAQNNHPSAQAGMNSLNVDERKLFDEFFFDCGALFLELKDELDAGLEELAEVHPEETDPRKWDIKDWNQFHKATEGHKFYHIYRLMAEGKSNIHLIWEEIERRLD